MTNKLPADPTAIILGIISIVIAVPGCCCGLFALVSLVLGIIGLVVANKSLNEYSREPEIYNRESRNSVYNGKIMCVIGVVVSSIFMLFSVGYFAFYGQGLSKKILENYRNKKIEYTIQDTIDTAANDEYQESSDTIAIDTLVIKSTKQN